jgi:hypothetical protein
MIRRFVLCAAALLILSAIAFGQGQVVKVNVDSADNEESKSVASILRGKIGSTLRYALTEPTSADVLIQVLCVSGRDGSACAEQATYYSAKAYGTAFGLATQVSLGDAKEVAQGFFDHLVEQTSAEKLQSYDTSQLFSMNKIWAKGYAEGFADAHESCGGKLPKKN